MSEDDDFPTTILMSFTTKVDIVRIIGTMMMPVSINIKTEIFPMEGAEAKLSETLSKIKYWFDNVVDQSVAFSGGNSELSGLLVTKEGNNSLDNNYLMTPGEPTDDLLTALFQAKMAALGKDVILVEGCEINTNNNLGLKFTIVGDPLELLPAMEEWIGERTFFDEPWWNRDDASSMDLMPDDDADLNDKPKWAFSIEIKAPQQHESEVVRHDFRPKVIDGGRKKK